MKYKLARDENRSVGHAGVEGLRCGDMGGAFILPQLW